MNWSVSGELPSFPFSSCAITYTPYRWKVFEFNWTKIASLPYLLVYPIWQLDFPPFFGARVGRTWHPLQVSRQNSFLIVVINCLCVPLSVLFPNWIIPPFCQRKQESREHSLMSAVRQAKYSKWSNYAFTTVLKMRLKLASFILDCKRNAWKKKGRK